MKVTELSDRADKIINCAESMKRLYTSRTWDFCLKSVIMIGLKDAYNEGMRTAEVMAGKTNKNFQDIKSDISTGCNVRIHKIKKSTSKKPKK